MSTAVHDRLRVTDPGRWRALALAWRRWAALAGRLAAEFPPHRAALAAVWRGAAADAAARRLDGLRRRLVLFRLHCWRADQVVSEFAAALERAMTLLGRSAADPALRLAAGADVRAAEALHRMAAAIDTPAEPPDQAQPGCTAGPSDVRRWWAGLGPARRQWLLATEPGAMARLDGLPAADRDLANRLLLDERRAEIDRAVASATGRDRERLRQVRDGLAALADRLADGDAPRSYLLRLDLAEEGRAVVAIGDPDAAGAVLTHVPGMTADLASIDGELARAERVAARATQAGPAMSTSAVLWLDYDAPDFVDEAAGERRAEAAAPALRRFQEGLRAAHDGPPGRQTVLGHSYGSLVVGKAAAGPGLDADSVVFVGSPGVGVDAAADLRVPAGQVWASTARNDIIQWAAVGPRGLARDVAVAAGVPIAGPWLAFARPERDLWFGHNPGDPAFGARVFVSAPRGHAGYWDPDNPALDTLAAITLGTAR